MSWIEDLFAYVDEFAPDFRLKVQGANKEEIERLKSVLGVPIPLVYLEYLRAMGRSDGGLFESARALTDVSTMITAIEGIKDEDPTADFAAFIPIAVGDVFEGWALVQKRGELPVHLIDHNRPGGYVARSLPHLAFHTAFGWRIKLAAHQVRFRIRDSKIQLTKLAERAAELGFSPEWFCDHLSYFGISPNAFLQIHPGPVRGFDGFVTAQDVVTARQSAEALAVPFGGILTYER